tara:strand:+ start:488 stop:856 length:369 start_codon:yes stop_codon:yes gene_type:complete
MELTEISAYIHASRDVLGLLKTMTEMMPKGQEADRAADCLKEAERVLQVSEAQLAKALGYTLCQCTFPPQIMLSKGHHARHDTEVFQCPSCNKQEPSDHHFNSMDKLSAYNQGKRGGTWMTR